MLDPVEFLRANLQKLARVIVYPDASVAYIKEEYCLRNFGGNVGKHPVQKSKWSVKKRKIENEYGANGKCEH
jgi:hypothetical protein